jgi:hypothetical protein
MQHAPSHKPAGFFRPYLVIRVMPAVYLTVPLPTHANTRMLVARAWAIMSRLGQRHRMCLVVSPKRGRYLEPGGSSVWRSDIPGGGIRIVARRVNYRALGGAGKA